jgi:hypothetical protein
MIGVPTAQPTVTPTGGAECTTLKGLHDSAWCARLSTLSYKTYNGLDEYRPYLL